MKWTIKRIEDVCNELSRDHNDEFNVPVLINSRFTSTYGRATYQRTSNGDLVPTKIEMSKQLLETASDASIIGVIKHEWAHYYITKVTKENHHHDAEFHVLCSSIGCNGDAHDDVERIVKVESKYELICPCCGKTVGTYSRKCKTTDAAKAGVVTSKCCNRVVELKQNW